MKTALVGVLCLIFASVARGIDGTTAPSPNTAIVVLSGTVDDYTKSSLIKRFEQARKLGAKTIILQINTYGGLVTSGLEISQFLKRQNDLQVIGFVDEKAISAGAMIALACNHLVMQPGSKLGDCAPISLSNDGALQTMGTTERAKMESPILADFEDSAKRNGYDPLLVQSMVSLGRVVHWVENDAGDRRFVDGPTYSKLIKDGWKPVADMHDPIDGATSLLTLNADDALKLGLAKSLQPSAEALAKERGLEVVATLQNSAGDSIIELLSSATVRGLLTTIFLFALYTSFSSPGHGLAETIAVTTLCLLIGVPLLTGYAQWWEILAILMGVLLICLEIFVIPGFGVTGISGIILLLFGLVMTFVGDEPLGIPGILPRLPGTWEALKQGVIVIVSGMFCSLLLWFWLQRYLPKLPYFNKLILTTTSGDIIHGQAPVQTTTYIPVGARGKAVTDLRPGGSAAFHDASIDDSRILDVISDSGFVPAGTELVVREVQGNHIVVRATT